MYPYNQNLNQNLYQQLLQPMQQDVVKVNGRGGAEAYQLAPNSSILLLDTTAPMVWLVQTDGAGYKSFTPYDITPHEEEKPVDNYKSLEERIKKLEEAVNGKPDTTNVKRKSE